MAKKKTIKQLYAEFNHGDPLTNKELLLLYNHVQGARIALYELGEHFHVTGVFLLNMEFTMQSYLTARNIDF